MTNELQHSVSIAAELITNSQHLVAFTGAGISTPSGIPDFRSAGTGLWERFDPMKVVSASAFRHHPECFYAWLKPLLNLSHQAIPNAAHFALAQLEQIGKLKAVITQNIDGLHQKSGSGNVIELHGSLEHFYCPSCRNKDIDIEDILTIVSKDALPECNACGKIIRPDITLFEEALPADAWQQAEAAIAAADLLLVAGSSLEVAPAAYLPFEACRRRCPIIIVNFTSTSIDTIADVVIHGDVAECLPGIVDLLPTLENRSV